MNDKVASPNAKYITDSRDNVFLIEELNLKQSERFIQRQRQKLRIGVLKLTKVYHRYYFLLAEEKQLSDGTWEDYDIVKHKEKLERKMYKDLGFKFDKEAKKSLIKTEKQLAFAERQKQIINLTIMQLENGAEPALILHILKQSRTEEDK